MMRTPPFWYQPKQSWQSVCLRPASWLFALGAKLRAGKPVRLPVPLIAVGNATAGGSGKTPIALALHDLLAQAQPDRKIWFLSRGTGGTANKTPTIVQPSGSARLFGDEPLLLAQSAPTVIARNRGAGALYAAENGANLIIMDDGLQNKTIAPDVRLLVVDGSKGFGNFYIIPAGPLRENAHSAIKRADAVIIVGSDLCGIRSQIPAGKPVIMAERRPAMPLPDPTLRYYLFSGIAHPERFLQTAREAQLNVAGFKGFPDHHAFSQSELKDLMDAANQCGAHLLTTEKDAKRLPAGFPAHALKIRAEFDAPDTLLTLINKAIA